jgi:hypothetical protein
MNESSLSVLLRRLNDVVGYLGVEWKGEMMTKEVMELPQVRWDGLQQYTSMDSLYFCDGKWYFYTNKRINEWKYSKIWRVIELDLATLIPVYQADKLKFTFNDANRCFQYVDKDGNVVNAEWYQTDSVPMALNKENIDRCLVMPSAVSDYFNGIDSAS